MFANIAIGLETALSWTNLLYCFFGVTIGMFVGVLPGIGAITAITLLFPMTFGLEVATSLIMLGGIWYGSSFGSAITAILLNIPGSPTAAATTIDGYPIAKSGRAGLALMIAATASFCGASIGIITLMVLAPTIAHYALDFGSAEYFSLMLLGLVAASTMGGGGLTKTVAGMVLGIIFGTVGMDIYSTTYRLNFGMLNLYSGVNIVSLAMGIFAVSEVISNVRSLPGSTMGAAAVSYRSMLPTLSEIRRIIGPILRGAGCGVFFGTLPGTGPTIASFMSYAAEKKVSLNRVNFGKGAIEGVAAPESANNAADITAFIPTLTLGIPGSATMSIMLAALLIQGVKPGPLLISSNPSLFWGIVMSFWIGNVMLILLNIPLIGIWTKVLSIPYNLLFPAIIVLVALGVYGVNQNTFEVWVVIFFGFIGYLMKLARISAATMLLGFVLGPMLEEHFRRAMLISGGDVSIFVSRPISAFTMFLIFLLLLWPLLRRLKNKSTPVTRKYP